MLLAGWQRHWRPSATSQAAPGFWQAVACKTRLTATSTGQHLHCLMQTQALPCIRKLLKQQACYPAGCTLLLSWPHALPA